MLGLDALIASDTFSSKGKSPTVNSNRESAAFRNCAIDGSNVSGSADAGARHSTLILSPPMPSAKYERGGIETTTIFSVLSLMRSVALEQLLRVIIKPRPTADNS